MILVLDKRTNANYLTVNEALQNKKTLGATTQGEKKDHIAFIKKKETANQSSAI